MSEFWDNLVDRLQAFGENLIEWIIVIGVALVVLIIGRWIARLLSRILSKLLDAQVLNGVWERSGVSRALAEGDQTPGSIAFSLVYAYLMIVVLLIIAGILNLPSIEELLLRLLAWIPLLLLAAFIVIVFAAAGSWAAGLVRPFAQAQNVPWLTYLVQIGVIVFGLLFAMEVIQVDFAQDIVKIVIAASTIALAIAFGVGGIDAGRKWWAKYGSPQDGGSSGGSSDY